MKAKIGSIEVDDWDIEKDGFYEIEIISVREYVYLTRSEAEELLAHLTTALSKQTGGGA